MKLTLVPPMPRMLGLQKEDRELTVSIPLDEECSLAAFLQGLSETRWPSFQKLLLRAQDTYFEQIRIAVDGVFAGSDYSLLIVRPESEVIIFSPYIDG